MEMEDKESTESGSPGRNSDSESPPSSGGAYGGGGGGPFPEVMNMEVEKSDGVPLTSGGGGVAGGSGIIAGGGAIGGGGNGELAVSGKKKRGRPRKYDENGNLSPSYLKLRPGAAGQAPAQPGFTLSTPPSYQFLSGSKRGRGKSTGSGTWKIIASLGELLSNSAGGDFTPHVVTVYAGEDVAGKIVTFAQKGPGGICILSANGSVSNVTIRQPGSSGGLLTYEGRFEILTLTGSFTVSENGKMKSQTGGLSVSLASPDGRVIGGGVAGMLTAANPIQIVVGSFVPNVMKLKKGKQNNEARIATPALPVAPPATVTAATPISQAAPNANTYPFQTSQFPIQIQGVAENNVSTKDNQSPVLADTADWNGSGTTSFLQRPSPDINISIHVDEH